MATLIERWNSFMENTKLYREAQEERQECIKQTLEKNTKELLNEITAIKEALLKLPCGIHEERFGNIKWQINAIYGIIGAVSLALLGAWIRLIVK